MFQLAERPVLTTPRLRLRAPRCLDAEAIAALADDEGLARMTVAVPHPYRVEDARGFLQASAAGDRRRQALFAIEAADEGLVGLVGFAPDRDGAPEVGYWLGRPFWGRGYMTEALGAALRWAAGEWGRRYVLARHFADNEASGRVLIKTGFLYTGDVDTVFSRARAAVAPARRMVWLA